MSFIVNLLSSKCMQDCLGLNRLGELEVPESLGAARSIVEGAQVSCRMDLALGASVCGKLPSINASSSHHSCKSTNILR